MADFLLPALSIYWVLLVLPATLCVAIACYVFLKDVSLTLTSSEVIGLSLRTSASNPYLNVQAFTGAMYIVSFSFCKGPVPDSPHYRSYPNTYHQYGF